MKHRSSLWIPRRIPSKKTFFNKLKEQSTENTKWRSRGGLDVTQLVQVVLGKNSSSINHQQQQHRMTIEFPFSGGMGITNVYRNNWEIEHTVLLLNHIETMPGMSQHPTSCNIPTILNHNCCNVSPRRS